MPFVENISTPLLISQTLAISSCLDVPNTLLYPSRLFLTDESPLNQNTTDRLPKGLVQQGLWNSIPISSVHSKHPNIFCLVLLPRISASTCPAELLTSLLQTASKLSWTSIGCFHALVPCERMCQNGQLCVADDNHPNHCSDFLFRVAEHLPIVAARCLVNFSFKVARYLASAAAHRSADLCARVLTYWACTCRATL